MSEIDRRDFLKLVGVGAGATAAAGCSDHVEKLIPYVIQPEEITPGIPVFYASTCRECPAGCGLHVKTREGRPIKLEGNPDHPVNRGSLCSRGQSGIERTYHPDRYRSPMLRGSDGRLAPITWEEATAKLTQLGVDLAAVELIVDPTLDGESWTRDWGPSALFDENGNYHLLDPTFHGYPMAMPDCDGRLYNFLDLIPFLSDWLPGGGRDLNADSLAKVLGVSTVKLPFGLTGGNALVDGHGTVFSTCVMLKENREWF